MQTITERTHLKEPPYTIMCDIPTIITEGVTKQFLVNRKKAPENWWTFNQPDIVFKIYSYELALKHISRFKNNNPQIVSWRSAVQILNEQAYLTSY